MAVCVLLRHGHSTANRDGVLAGWTPGVGLTETGREQAAHAARQLAEVPLAQIVSSPVQRARETAELLAQGRPAAPVTIDEGLRECGYGAWTGRSLSELRSDPLWRLVQDAPELAVFPDDPDGTFPAESLAAMTARIVDAVRRIDERVSTASGPDAVWVAVSHGDPIKAVLAVAGGADVHALQSHHVDPGAMSVIRFGGGRSVVLAANCRIVDVASLVAATRDAPPGEAAVGGGSG